LALVHNHGRNITKGALQEFRDNVLDRDDVFRPEFCSNIVFVGAHEADVNILPDALDELASWQVKSRHFVAGTSSTAVAPGPYVLLRGKTWQPWRVYYDFNACFMTSFMPSPDSQGR
jgi:hypothetical protein